MRRLRDYPIRVRLIGTILLVSSFTLLTAGFAIVGYELGTARDRTERDLIGLAELTGLNIAPALRGQDREAARQGLRTLATRMTIVGAAAYGRDGRLFASFQRPGTSAPPIPAEPGAPGVRVQDGHADVFRAIPVAGEPVGTVYLQADLSPLQDRLRRYVLIVVALFAGLMLLGWLLAAVLQRGISAPILALAHVARAVTERRDYSLRAGKRGEDEIGLLTDAFNQMLCQIQSQDRALRDLNAQLEQRVAARTAELQALNKELESFSYSVSHDLRAPLRGIDGFTRILEEDYGERLDADARRVIGVIRDSCARMSQLIDDLLAFSRLGRKALSIETVDMGALVAELLAELGAVPGTRMPAVDLQPLPPAHCDRTLIRQVWVNLLTNAIKFSSRRERPQLRIWSPQAGAETVYAVGDNGVGFDMRDYDKLFGVFQRLHSGEEYPGTGVGLATAARILTRHGGRIWAEGRPGEGATFYFALPAPGRT